MNKIILILAIMLMMPIVYAVDYTPTTETQCINNICSTNFYSGTRYINENNKWIPVEDAKSLMGKGFNIVFLDIDKDLMLNVIDFNYTSITIETGVSIALIGQDIPIKIYEPDYRINERGEPIKEKIGDFKQDYLITYSSLINYKEDEKITKTLSFGVGKILEFGANSTVITMQNNITQNLEDTYVYATYEPDTNYGNSTEFNLQSQYFSQYIKWNINSTWLPRNITIINATMDIWMHTAVNDAGGLGNVIISGFSNQTWVEETPTYNNQPAGTKTNYINQSATTTVGWYSFNATYWITNQWDLNLPNASLFIYIIVNGTSSDYMFGYSKEYTADTAKRPKLIVYYYSPDEAPVTILNTPADNYSYYVNSSLSFSCSASNYYNIANLTLYTNRTGIWKAEETKTMLSDNTTQTFSVIFNATGKYIWNCLAFNTKNLSAYADVNRSLTISTIYFFPCNGSETSIINFTLKSEETQNIISTDAAGEFIPFFSSIQGDTYSVNYTNVSSWKVCSYYVPSVTLNAIIQYNNGTGTAREYYFDSATLINGTQYIDLYILPASLAKTVKFTVYDSTGTPIENAIVYIQRHYINQGAYITVAMLKTDSNGKDQTVLRGSDTFYKFIVQQDGAITATLAPTKLPIDAITNEGEYSITINPEAVGAIYDFYNQVAFGCTYNNATKVLSCIISDNSGLGRKSQLIVTKTGMLSSSVICDNTVESVSTTHTCSLGAGANGTFNYQFYAILDDNNKYLLDAGTITISSAPIIYGTTGLFLAFLLFLVAVGIGSWNISAGILTGMTSIIASSLMGLIAIDLSIIISLIVASALIIYKLNS